MKTCEFCDTQVADNQRICPICAERIGNGTDITYPVYRKASSRRKRLRFWSILSLVVLTAATVIVNISIGGRAWSLYAVAGAIVHYQAFYARKQVESSLIRKFVSIVISVCVLMVVVQVLSPAEVASVQMIIPIILWGALIIVALLYFTDFQSQKSHLTPILLTICISFVCIGTGLWIFNVIKWPSIVLMSISTVIVLLSLIFFRKPIKAEMRKKLHI